MRLFDRLLTCAIAFALALPLAAGTDARAAGQSPKAPPAAAEATPQQAATAAATEEAALDLGALPPYADRELVREHQLFSQFARAQVERMNANILGGRSAMQVHKGADGLYHASFKAIDATGVICQVSRANSDPHYFVGNLIYKEQLLMSAAETAEACRKGPFEPVSEKANRIIYTSRRGGGWQ